MTCTDYDLWSERPLVVFDVETTGVDPDAGDRVVEVGVARFHRGHCTGSWGGLIHPQRPIPAEAAEIHGIDDAAVRHAPPFTSVLPHVIRLARDAHPVAYRADFDKQFLLSEVSRLSVDLEAVPMFDSRVRWLDPLVWVRRNASLYGNKLTQVCERWGIAIDQAHRATSDARATGALLYAMHSDGQLPAVTMCELLRKQQQYADAQETDIQAWLARKRAREARGG